MLEVLDLELLAAVAEVDHVPGRARRRDGGHFVERELPLGEDVHDLPPDIPRRADNGHPIAHSIHSEILGSQRVGAAPYRKLPWKAIGSYAIISRERAGGRMRKPVVVLAAMLIALLGLMAAKSWLIEPP